MEAFVYCWTDHKTEKLYIGSHKGSDNDGYVCSSKIMLEEFKLRPNDFTRQIIAHGTWDDIFALEGTLLRTLDVRNDVGFYNQHNGNGDFRLKHKTDEHKKKISETLKGRKQGPRSEVTKQKMRKPKSDEHRAKFLGNQNAKGRTKTVEEIEKTRLKNMGKKRSPEALEKLRLGAQKGWLTRRANGNT